MSAAVVGVVVGIVMVVVSATQMVTGVIPSRIV